MSLSRRQFFRRFVPGKKTPEERGQRYDTLATYVRTHLLPYDFGLTPPQEAELFAAVRSLLEQIDDEELFTTDVRYKVEQLANTKINAWRDEIQLNDHGTV